MAERFPVAYLFPLRLLFGIILLLEGWGKLQGNWLHGDPLAATLGRWLAMISWSVSASPSLDAGSGVADMHRRIRNARMANLMKSNLGG